MYMVLKVDAELLPQALVTHLLIHVLVIHSSISLLLCLMTEDAFGQSCCVNWPQSGLVQVQLYFARPGPGHVSSV